MIDSNTRVIALFGMPARHSLSPQIQNYFIQKYHRNAVYLVFEFSPHKLRKAFHGAKNLGFIGLNVTMPFKEEIYNLVDKLDKTSSITKSVNTVKFEQESSCSTGFNTDVNGFLKSLQEKNFDWGGKKCLVIGAGGAAKSAVYGLLQKSVEKIYLYNRTEKRAIGLIRIFKNIFQVEIEIVSDLNKLENEVEDISLIVNCTPMGMDGTPFRNMLPIPSHWNLKGKTIFDMVYNPVKTNFIEKGIKDGAVVISGINMLINQAASSFKVWFDIMPETSYISDIKNTILKINRKTSME